MNMIKPSVEIITEPDLFKRIELAARTCYKSEGNIREGSAEKLFQKLIARGHESALEHSNIIVSLQSRYMNRVLQDYRIATGRPAYIRSYSEETLWSGNLRAWRDLCKALPESPLLYGIFNDHKAFCDIEWRTGLAEEGFYHIVEDPGCNGPRHEIITARFICDRGVSHELVRHRALSFSQESTRYVNYREGITVIEPWWWENIASVRETAFNRAMTVAEESYKAIIESGGSPQQARAVLPNALKTEIVATGTVEQWKEVLRLRLAKGAHPDMQRVMRLFAEAAGLQSEIPTDKKEECP